jgi:integrase
MASVATIAYREVSFLLADIRDGRNGTAKAATAARLHAHLRDFFSWAAREQIIGTNPISNMPAPAMVARRTRVYSDAALKAIWNAADQLEPEQGMYIKLMMLLALRRDELAQSEWSEFDSELTLFTVPTSRVKMKASAKLEKQPVYKVPLPQLAQRLLKRLRQDRTMVFKNLDPSRLSKKLVREGAPEDFLLHTFRHTVATWLENNGRSEWERGLVLNHSGGGSVTGGYSHGYPLELKLKMLTEWADHISRLVAPAEG